METRGIGACPSADTSVDAAGMSACATYRLQTRAGH
jgi:hypothetical protein